MANPKIRLLEEDPELKARSLELAVNGKSLVSPHRALYLQLNNDSSEARIISGKTLRGLNEIYVQKNFEDIQSLRTDVAKQTKLISGFQNTVNKSKIGEEVILGFLHYDARKAHQRNEFLDNDVKKKDGERKKNPNYRKFVMPSKDDTDYLVRLYSALPSDILAPPILQGADGESYLVFLKDFFEIVNSTSRLRTKTIMGIIPKVADLELPGILDFYNKKDVRLYGMNFAGGHPLNFVPQLIKMSQFFESIEKDYKEECYLHGLNVGYGRIMEKMVIPARNVLSFSIGLDSFGVSHLGGGGGDDKIEGTAEQRRIVLLKEQLRKTTLFNRSDYGYHKYEGNSEIKAKFSKDDQNTIYDLEAIAKAASAVELRGRIRIFNAERHAIEARYLTEEILGKKGMKEYIEKKNAVDSKTMKEVSKVSKKSKER